MPGGGRGERGPYPLVDLELALAPRRRPNPFVVGWRWRYELGALAAITVVTAGPVAAGLRFASFAILGAVGLTAAMLPAARDFVRSRFWCVVTPHRVRTACAQAWIHSRSGRIPAVLWTSSERFGERVILWCPAGVTGSDLELRRGMLATACWAQDVRVVRSRRHPQLVTLAVVRNGPEEVLSGRPTGPDEADLPGDDGTIPLRPTAS